MQKSLAVVFSLFFATILQAQNIQIESSAFPEIIVKITSGKALKQSDVKILQSGKDVNFTWKEPEKKSSASAKSVYFLIETSGFTNNLVINNFKKGVNNFILNAPEGVLLNASSFWKANAESKILNNLSADFTTKKEALVEEINQKIKPVTDTQQQADLHKAIYDAIDYVAQTASSSQKQIVVLTAGINRSYSPIRIEDCVDKAIQNGVQVFSLVHKTGFVYALDNLKKLADKTSAQTELVNSAEEITSNLQRFIQTESNSTSEPQTYQVAFILPNPADVSNFEISILGQKQPLNINKPSNTPPKEENETLPSNTLYIVLAVIIVGGGIAYFWWKDKQKKAKQAEQERHMKAEIEKQQQIIQQANVQPSVYQEPFYQPTTAIQEPQKFDPKKTMIGGGGGAPTLIVSGEGFQQTFTLYKPTMTIGRRESNDITIPIATVSGYHATLSNEGGNWFISDNNSTNGVILNGNRIQKHILKNGDKIQLGGAVAIFKI